MNLAASPPHPAQWTVTVVIVNYRTGALVVECLRSLRDELRASPGSRVVVVDNASPDGSGRVIEDAIAAEGWSGWARLLHAPRNGGFSYGNNLVLREGLSDDTATDAYWLLNPDTRVHPGAMTELAQFLQHTPQAGIAGSALHGDDGRLWPIAFRFPSVLGELEGGIRMGLAARLLARHAVARPMGAQAEPVDWLPGASMMMRREVLRQVGLMDEGYFLYFEETDYALRARTAGWQTWYVPASRVVHIAGQSTGVTGHRDVRRRRPDYWFDSRRRYFVKHHGRAYAVAADLTLWLATAVCHLRDALLRREPSDPPHFLFDLFRHSALFRP